METKELKLKRLKLTELRVGMPTPWPVFFTANDMAMDIGFIPESEEQILNLMDRGLFRYPTELESKAEPEEHASFNLQPVKPNQKPAEPPPQPRGDITTLEQVKLNIGDNLQLQLKGDTHGDRYAVTLIGYLAGEGVIVSTPVKDGRVMMFREGQAFVVRMFSGKSAFAFTAEISKITNSPYPHIHLAWPKEVRGLVVRSSSRAKTNIICHASSPGNEKGYACVARDISIGGALIAAKDKIAGTGDKLILKMRVNVGDEEHMLIIDCEVRSINTSRLDGEGNVLHGLSFTRIEAQDKLVITAMLYQNMMNEQTEG